MKDFAKSIVCNTKAELAKVGNKEWKPGDTGTVERARIPYKVKILKVDGPWATFVFLNGEFKGQTDEELLSQIRTGNKKTGNSRVGNGLLDSYEFLMSAGKNDYNSIKEEVKKAGGWTPEIKAKARKTSDTLKKKAKELVETAHKQSAELEKIAGDIESI